VAAEYDRTMKYPIDVFTKAWELGLVNTHIPEEYGGPGLGCTEGVIIGAPPAVASPACEGPRVHWQRRSVGTASQSQSQRVSEAISFYV